jgi:rare lipoprotein A
MRWPLAAALCLAALLAACGSAPRSGPGDAGGDNQRDGPPAHPPPDLIDRPDAVPRVEPIRSGGPNKPYVVFGQAYTPVASDEAIVETGLASWYGRKFHGRPTANGELYDMYGMTAAHRTMPLPSYALVRNPANGREVVVRVNDRGPFHRERIIDLSYAAALKLGVLGGLRPVEVQRLTHDEIRSGEWRRGSGVLVAAPAPRQGPPPQPPSPSLSLSSAPAEEAGSPSGPTVAPGPEPAAQAAPAVAAVVSKPADAGAAGYWLQFGAFRQHQGAKDLQQQLSRELAWLEPWLAVFDERALFRVLAGPFASRGDALGAAERIRGMAGPQPLLVQRP